MMIHLDTNKIGPRALKYIKMFKTNRTLIRINLDKTKTRAEGMKSCRFDIKLKNQFIHIFTGVADCFDIFGDVVQELWTFKEPEGFFLSLLLIVASLVSCGFVSGG